MSEIVEDLVAGDAVYVNGNEMQLNCVYHTEHGPSVVLFDTEYEMTIDAQWEVLQDKFDVKVPPRGGTRW